MNIKRWFWIKANTDKTYKNNLYVYNPYLKDAEYCIGTINIINKTNYKLKDVKYWFEG